MSSPVIHAVGITLDVDPSIAPPRRLRRPVITATPAIKAVIPYDSVLDSGLVCFKVAQRINPSRLSFIARSLYRLFVRALPRWWPSRPDSLHVPPAPKAEKGVFDNDKWWPAVAECRTPDHQINVMPANRSWPDDPVTYAERACRPLDISDPHNVAMFRALSKMYGGSTSLPATCSDISIIPPRQAFLDALHRIEETLKDISERMLRVEEREDSHRDSSGLTDGGG